MKIFFIREGDKEINICGVEGAGKKSFISTFFPNDNVYFGTIKNNRNTKRVLFVFVLDGVHLQNLEEEEIFAQILNYVKRDKHSTKISCLLILNKTDLFYSKRKAPMLIHEICDIYNKKLENYGFADVHFIAFSYLATKKFHALQNRNLNREDCEDICFFLNKIGRHFASDISPSGLQKYLHSHTRALLALSGEELVKRYVMNWRRDN